MFNQATFTGDPHFGQRRRDRSKTIDIAMVYFFNQERYLNFYEAKFRVISTRIGNATMYNRN